MRYQVRLVGEDLSSFHHRLCRHAWAVLETLLPDRGREAAYRALFRRLKKVFSARIEAHEYCGRASACDAFLHAVDPGLGYRKTVPAGEAASTNHYLLGPAVTPGQLIGELSRESLVVLSSSKPGARIKGAGRRIHRAIREAFRDRLFRNEACGQTKLCGVSGTVDPWRRHPLRGAVQYSGLRG